MTLFAREHMTMETAAAGLNYPYGYARALHFHKAMGLTVGKNWEDTPPVSERLLRGRLLIEEVLETLNAMGLTLTFDTDYSGESPFLPHDGERVSTVVGIQHVEGSKYDPVETADGLADIKVIANGTAVAFGIPMLPVDFEVFASNMSKLDEDGKPVVNKCKLWMTQEESERDETRAYCADQLIGGDECFNPDHWIDPTKPIGKLLKPANYIPANIQGIYDQHTQKGTK